MPLIVKDRVMEISSTTGTGTITLGGAVTGYQAFSVIGNGNTTYYAIDNGTEWEVGIGTYTASGTTLSRDTVLESSNSGSLVNFSAGVKTVFVTYPAEKSVDLDTAQTISNKTIISPSVTTPSVTATTNDLTLSSVGTNSVLISSGNGTQFKVNNTYGAGGTAVNFFSVYGRQSGSSPIFAAEGTDSALSPIFAAKAGNFLFRTADITGGNQFVIAHTASAVNNVQVTGAATGNKPTISAQGSDTNINLDINSKGNGNVTFNSGTSPIFRMAGSASTANYLQAIGSPTNQEPVLSAQGSDANISLALQSKGTGSIDLASGSTGVNVSNGTTVTAITRTAVGTNYTSAPSVAISAPNIAGGVQATATCSIGVATFNLASGGTGYTVGDVLTIVGGTFTTAATVTVTAVSGGVITATSATSTGTYTAAPTNPVSVTGGTGTGATFNPTFGVLSTFTITNAGSGYTSQPTVTFSGGGGSGASAYATVGSGTFARSLGSSLQFQTPGGTQFAVSDGGVTSGAYWQAVGGVGTADLRTAGAGVLQGAISTQSAVPISFRTNFSEQLRVSHTASAVNYVQVTGSATGGRPVISAQGSDANISWALQSKGTFGLTFLNSSNGIIGTVTHSGSSTPNYLQLAATTTTGAPALQAQGGDTNIDLNITTKGTGAVNLNSGNGITARFLDSNATITAYPRFTAGGSAQNTAYMTVDGSAANPNLYLTSKGSGNLILGTNNGAQQQFQISHTSSAVNYVQVTGSATGVEASVSVQGSDTNASLSINAKGVGAVNLRSGTQAIVSATSGGASTDTWLSVTRQTAKIDLAASSVAATNADISLTPKGTGKVVITNGIQGGTF